MECIPDALSTKKVNAIPSSSKALHVCVAPLIAFDLFPHVNLEKLNSEGSSLELRVLAEEIGTLSRRGCCLVQ